MLFKEKQLLIILKLRDSSKDWNISGLAKETGTTYVHSCNFVSECENAGLVTGEKHGKIKVIKLTDRGKRIADSLFEVYNSLTQQTQQTERKTAQPSQQEVQQ